MSDVKKFILVICVILVLILCFPISWGTYEDGTSMYGSVLFKVVIWGEGNSIWIDKDGNTVDAIPEGKVSIYFFPNNMKKLHELERIEIAKSK
ncbi:MAG: hypothetical protein IKJ94_07285 [Oscillospiraceae bacterium]|nr:hypothetical protein [Oscillospiraceae bacterium]